MGFEINLNALLNIAKMTGDKQHIDASSEVEATKTLFSGNATDPIGDTVNFTTKKQKPATAFTTADMINELVNQDPNIDKTKLNTYMSKPVETLPESFEFDRPYSVDTMAKMAQDVDINKLNAYLDAAFATGAAERADEFALEFEESIGGDDKNAQTAYTIGVLHEVGALEE